MAITPSGILSIPMDKLADLWAASATFLTETGAADATEARAKFIHLVAEPPKVGGKMLRPMVIVGLPRNHRWSPVRRGAFGMGQIPCWYEADVLAPNKENETEAALAFLNPLGDILKEIFTASVNNATGTLNVTDVSYETNPVRSTTTEGDAQDFFAIRLTFEFGPRR